MNNKYHFNRRNLIEKIESALSKKDSGKSLKQNLLPILKNFIDDNNANIKELFMKEKNGFYSGELRSKAIDAVILSTYDVINTHAFPIANPTKADKLSVIAVGGYGRGNLAPGSDIDILILTPYKITPRIEQVVESLLYILWDLKLKVGYAIRSLEDNISKAKSDNTICTALLDARLISGDQDLWINFNSAFKLEILSKFKEKYFYEKIKERDIRHKKMGDSRYLLEPNIKENKGGLRDLNTIRWIISFLYQSNNSKDYLSLGIMTNKEASFYNKAEKYFMTLRSMMHYYSKNNSDRLTFDLQLSIADKMGYKSHSGSTPIERLMKHYYLFAKEVGYLTKSVLENIETNNFKTDKSFLKKLVFNIKKNKNGVFEFYGNSIHLAKTEKNIEPLDIFRAYDFSAKYDLNLSNDLINIIKSNIRKVDTLRTSKKANAFFLNVLTNINNSEKVLRSMSEIGALGRFIPDFQRVVARVQHDMYHTYTVDEHTINAIGILRKIDNGELKDKFDLATEVIKKIVSKNVLYVALFLHDIAKGRGGDHSVLGGEVAKNLCPRFGLNADETETVVWLVENHLLMSHVAFKRDLQDPNTIIDLKKRIQSAELLRLLYVLTVADITAVGPEIWNSWKDNLLKIVYNETLMEINGGGNVKSRTVLEDKAKNKLRNSLSEWSNQEFENHIKRFFPYYWTNINFEVHKHHAKLIREADSKGLKIKIDIENLDDQGVTEISIYTQDHLGLFARTCAGLALAGTSVQDARIVTTKDGMTVNTFLIRSATTFSLTEDKNRLSALVDTIRKTISEERDPKVLIKEFKNIQIPSRKDSFIIEPRVLIDNLSSRTHTLIEINSKDKIGLLHTLASELFLMGLHISTARISTYGVRVVDVFYIKNMTGGKITEKDKTDVIKSRLMKAIHEHKDANSKILEKI
ncbi:MAG: [protein-PII] uridylyltransferase [Alphaproteobacteria bacterium]|nr:[protein-PII] uridylyltransferase [Alphaproteobacteria bacterium]